ncbi:hypothetical protein QQP08_014660 [Theobroma cacao]|nr:hypothetical protein QQP08_014660 [Theobroma cacao]
MIRYSSINFISQTAYSISFMIYDTRAVAYIYYYPTINMFMQNLSFAAGASNKSYAVAQTRLPDDHPLYGSDQLPQIVIAISIVGVVLLLTLAIGVSVSAAKRRKHMVAKQGNCSSVVEAAEVRLKEEDIY